MGCSICSLTPLWGGYSLVLYILVGIYHPGEFPMNLMMGCPVPILDFWVLADLDLGRSCITALG